MSKVKFIKKIKNLKHFFWLFCLVLISIYVTNFYNENKKNQDLLLKKVAQNIYFKKSLNKITQNLEPRYKYIDYKVKEGDTFENIIKKLNFSN